MEQPDLTGGALGSPREAHLLARAAVPTPESAQLSPLPLSPKPRTAQTCTRALLDTLMAFLLGERFLHHQHHFYIPYNEMADNKSILLITHPACYDPHKNHEQLEKP